MKYADKNIEIMNAALESYFSRESTLTPPLKNWEEDLPKSVETQHTAPRLTYSNEINKVWMEVPKHEDIIWGGGITLLPIGFFAFLVFLACYFGMEFLRKFSLKILFFLFSIFFHCFLCSQ